MNIEIRGAQTVNKGAELMLLAVMQELRTRLKNPELQFVVEPHSNYSIEKRMAYGLHSVPRYRRRRIKFGYLTKLIPKKIRLQNGLVTDDEVDVVIDISGFRYGDYWGSGVMLGGATAYLKKWKKSGKKIMFLPQAFGTFKNSKVRREAVKILEYSDFIAARDNDSLKYLKELNPETEVKSLFCYPDFTPSLEIEGVIEELKNKVLIIPNSKMLEKDETYVDYLVQLIGLLKQMNLEFAFLIHEGVSDFKIAGKVNEMSGSNIEILWEDDPLLTKKMIKSSFVTITSRFHGLINGLSQAIPTLSTSWSHKYERVLEEYDFLEQGLITNFQNIEETQQKLEFVIQNYSKVREELLKKSKEHKLKVDEMWRHVVNIIQS